MFSGHLQSAALREIGQGATSGTAFCCIWSESLA
jgi:hypothetical protein